jgi:hypothetical protein
MLCGKLGEKSPNLPHNETSLLRARVIPNKGYLSPKNKFDLEGDP